MIISWFSSTYTCSKIHKFRLLAEEFDAGVEVIDEPKRINKCFISAGLCRVIFVVALARAASVSIKLLVFKDLFRLWGTLHLRIIDFLKTSFAT